MAIGAKCDFERKLVEIYYDKTTLANDSANKDIHSLDAKVVLNHMELISLNRKAMINFKVSMRKAA